MPPPDPDEIERARQAAAERRLLNQIRLRSYTATPSAIVPFQQSTLAWNTSVPASVSSQLSVSFKLGNTAVPGTGTFAVSPLATGAFQLSVHSENTSRVLGSQVVRVDAGGCQEFQISRIAIERAAQQVKNLFLAGSISARGDLGVTMIPPDGIKLEAPLKVAIENFFDADLDVDLDVRLSVVSRPDGVRVAAARLKGASVDMIFHLAEHIFSLGTATAAQALVQPLAADLLKAFLGPQIEGQVARSLQEVINGLLELWRSGDPAKRVHRLYSLTANNGGLVIVGCPVPAPPPNPSPGTTFPGTVLTGTTLTGTGTSRARRRPRRKASPGPAPAAK
ncbi:MAG: hypothetical protein ACKVYV_16405 [Limisphaerales bacterium]